MTRIESLINSLNLNLNREMIRIGSWIKLKKTLISISKWWLTYLILRLPRKRLTSLIRVHPPINISGPHHRCWHNYIGVNYINSFSPFWLIRQILDMFHFFKNILITSICVIFGLPIFTKGPSIYIETFPRGHHWWPAFDMFKSSHISLIIY